MRYREKTIKSISDLIKALKLTIEPNDLVWFRGQSNSKWKLTPSLSRIGKGIESEIPLIKRFKQNALPLSNLKPISEWEWLFLMQHYGLPTRLLDWTESPLVAMYFAVNSFPDTDGALWCLLPIELNKLAGFKYPNEVEIPCLDTETDEGINSYLPSTIASERTSSQKPVAVMIMRNNPRVAAQLGSFTITHREHLSIDDIDNKKHIWRFIIPKEVKSDLQKELSFLKITKLSLFPDLESVAEEAREILL